MITKGPFASMSVSPVGKAAGCWRITGWEMAPVEILRYLQANSTQQPEAETDMSSVSQYGTFTAPAYNSVNRSPRSDTMKAVWWIGSSSIAFRHIKHRREIVLISVAGSSTSQAWETLMWVSFRVSLSATTVPTPLNHVACNTLQNYALPHRSKAIIGAWRWESHAHVTLPVIIKGSWSKATVIQPATSSTQRLQYRSAHFPSFNILAYQRTGLSRPIAQGTEQSHLSFRWWHRLRNASIYQRLYARASDGYCHKTISSWSTPLKLWLAHQFSSVLYYYWRFCSYSRSVSSTYGCWICSLFHLLANIVVATLQQIPCKLGHSHASIASQWLSRPQNWSLLIVKHSNCHAGSLATECSSVSQLPSLIR